MIEGGQSFAELVCTRVSSTDYVFLGKSDDRGILGRQPILIVCNRDKHELEPTGKATRRAWRTILDATRA